SPATAAPGAAPRSRPQKTSTFEPSLAAEWKSEFTPSSTDSDATPIATYTFDFGDGSVAGPRAGPTATRIYTTSGTFNVALTVTDTGGQSSSTTNASTSS